MKQKMSLRPDSSGHTPAPRRYRIQVTEKDIERAHRNNSYKCVVVQAIARTIRDATIIDVDQQTIRFTLRGERLVYLTPYAVQGYVVAFDAGDKIEPFSFELRNPIRHRRRKLTAAGRAVQTASARARSRAKRQPEATDEDVRRAAKAAYTAAVKTTTEPLQQSDGGGRQPPPRVFKRKQRSYGHRLLRINREMQA